MDGTYRKILLVQSLLALANATAAVFGVVYLLKAEGFPARDLVLFGLVEFLAASAVCLAIVRARPRHGVALMVAGLFVLISSYAAFVVLRGWPLLLYVAVAWGLYIPLFFLPFNALVVGTTRTEDRAGKIGGFIFAYTVVGVLAPSLGGAIAFASYDLLFAFAIVVLIADVAVLLRLKLGREDYHFAFDFRGMGPRTSVAVFAQGAFEGLAFGLTPLIAFAFTKEELSIGGLFSLFALAGGAITVALGIASDRLRNRRPFLLTGVVVSALAAILVARAATLAEFALANSLVSLTASIAPLFLFAISVERLPGRVGPAVATREVLLNAGRTVSLAASLALVLFGLTAQKTFLLAAFSLGFVALGAPRASHGPQPIASRA